MLKSRTTILLSAALLIVSCSGDGGDASLSYNGPTTLVAIGSEANADSIVSEVVSLEGTSSALSDATESVPIGVASSGSGKPFKLHTLGDVARQYTDIALEATTSSTSMLAGITSSQTEACSDGGTVTLTVNKSVPEEVNAGDSFSMTFNKCIRNASISNGAVSLVINSYDQVTLDFSASFTFSSLKITTTTNGDYVWLDGSYTAAFSGDGSATPLVASLSGTSLVLAVRSGGVFKNARLSNFSYVDTLATNGDFSFDHDYTIASTSIGGSIMVETVNPFIVYSGDTSPSVGQIVITGAAGASIRLTAIDHLTALVDYDLGGDGLYGNEAIDPASKVVYWADL